MMLTDAIRAEGYRLLKNRTTVFWSAAFLPLLTLVLSTLGVMAAKLNEKQLTQANINLNTPGGALDLGQTLLAVAADVANPAVLLFVLIGAATVYAGDYRWETWRLTSARNGRSALLLAKVVNVALLALAAIVLLALSKLVSDVIKGIILARPLAFSLAGDDVGRMLAVGGLGWMRVVQFTLIGLLTAVFSRSLLAALFVPLVVGVAQAAAPMILASMGVAAPGGWISMLVSPSQAFDLLKSDLAGEVVPLVALAPAATSFVLWLILPLVGALALFSRQDLSKE